VLSDVLLTVHNDHLTLVTLLHLSAAFYTVEHWTLLQRLELSYGIGGTAVSWFNGRTHSFVVNPAVVLFVVLLCTAYLLQLVKSHGIRPHLYVDDTQIDGFCGPGNNIQLQSTMCVCCIVDVLIRLQLNTD